MPNEMNVEVNEGNPNIIRQGFNVGLRTLSPTYMATDPWKLLARAEVQWQDRHNRQAAADTPSVYRLRWPSNPIADGLQRQYEQAHLESEVETMLARAKNEITTGRLDLAMQRLRWAAARSPKLRDRSDLEIFQWLSCTRLVATLEEGKVKTGLK